MTVMQRPPLSLNPRYGRSASARRRQARLARTTRPTLAVRGPRALLLGHGLVLLALAAGAWLLPVGT
jgi:uncharacterized membrane protein